MKTPAKIGLLTSLYLSQGLPYGFFTQALPALLLTKGVSLEGIGLSNLLALPWALKFLWAPWVDKQQHGRFGRRRAIIGLCQLLSAAMLFSLVFATQSLTALLTVIFLINAISATQDIATDGLAVDILTPSQRGLGNGVQVAGYRAGMVLGGGFLLTQYDRLGWAGTFGILVTLVLVATIPILLFNEILYFQNSPSPTIDTLAKVDRSGDQSPSEMGSASANQASLSEQSAANTANKNGPIDGGIWARWRTKAALGWLVVLMVYKTGEWMATPMIRPMLLKQGMTVPDLGWLMGTVGFTAGLVGALLGGSLISKLGRGRSLILFGSLQACGILSLTTISQGDSSFEVTAIVCGIEHLTSGMATAALFTVMMDVCRVELGATDYTIQASIVVIATGIGAALSGVIAQRLGFRTTFVIGAVVSITGVLLTRLFSPPYPEGSLAKTESWTTTTSPG